MTKTITAASVLHLLDQGKLSLDDAVYPLLGKPRPLDRQTIDPLVAKITVRQLLLHAGGWDPKRTSDALHQTRKISRITAEKLPLAADTVLRYGLNQPLDFAQARRAITPTSATSWPSSSWNALPTSLMRPTFASRFCGQWASPKCGWSSSAGLRGPRGPSLRRWQPRTARRPGVRCRSGRRLAVLGRGYGSISDRGEWNSRQAVSQCGGPNTDARATSAATCYATQRLPRRLGMGCRC